MRILHSLLGGWAGLFLCLSAYAEPSLPGSIDSSSIEESETLSADVYTELSADCLDCEVPLVAGDEMASDQDLKDEVQLSEDEISGLAAIDSEAFSEDAYLDENGEVSDIIEISSTKPELALPDPLYTIESLSISGNSMTSDSRIWSIMGVSEGDRLQLRELEEAKIRLLTGGNFESVQMDLLPGSDRFKLKVVVRVLERLHLQINDLYVGASEQSNFWLGLNVSYLNLLGTGHRLSMAFVGTQQDEYAWALNYTIPKLGNTPVFLAFSLRSNVDYEDVFVRPGVLNDSTDWITSNDKLLIQRHGFSVITGIHPIDKLSVILGVQTNFIDRNDDRVQDIKRPAIDDFLHPGKSVSTTVFASVAYDSRDRFRMTSKGHQVGLNITGTGKSAASDYKFLRLMLFHQSNFELVPEHLLRIYTSAGAVFGEAPYYEKFLFNDFYLFTPNRILGLNPSSAAPYDLFKTGAADLSYEDFVASLTLEYAWMRELNAANIRRFEVYARVNASYADSLHPMTLAIGTNPGDKKRGAFPCDGSLDVGVNFDTSFGFFKVSLGYILNLIPR